MISGPLSTITDFDGPGHSASRSSTDATRLPGNDVSTIVARHFSVKTVDDVLVFLVVDVDKPFQAEIPLYQRFIVPAICFASVLWRKRRITPQAQVLLNLWPVITCVIGAHLYYRPITSINAELPSVDAAYDYFYSRF